MLRNNLSIYCTAQCVAAVTAGCTTSVLTNPLDLVRARVQVQRRSIPDTVRYTGIQYQAHSCANGNIYQLVIHETLTLPGP